MIFHSLFIHPQAEFLCYLISGGVKMYKCDVNLHLKLNVSEGVREGKGYRMH